MFNFTRAYRAIDDSLAEARKQLKEQERLLKIVGKYSMGDEIKAKKIKLEELIEDLTTTKSKMQNLRNQEKLKDLCELSSMNPREFTLRVLVNEERILADSRVDELFRDATKLDTLTVMQIADHIMDDYPANTGIRWIMPYL
jgi:hypothetical protein